MSTRSTEAAADFQVLAKGCASRSVLDHVTGRWGALIVIALREDPKRFAEIRRAVDGINEKALAQSLRRLERDGFVDRLASDGYPSRVEYRLTESGSRIAAGLCGLVELLYDEMPRVLIAQSAYDARHPEAPRP
ncbi:helix-turn-helix transcriptional regulator [Glycomyces sp. TRM65418]|uniref:winged helix-turn-helix transcriptional regulator n=1 Tax=Glycomyces sp. TRM65418 TaxID=2867006 RepID=UPI001CE5C5D5|nr:helix-turn-helix domain-containing protein [Glycomyces sp. TRM65418]MCC3765084.1 helix-turn-helix transcriptional regulator [Glycomyces sp. TRM65418]QZD54713.1 helix-turn-helix transcriptional regulator [Glycomyces sp. TRM65418]